jgi:hypothetical protein
LGVCFPPPINGYMLQLLKVLSLPIRVQLPNFDFFNQRSYFWLESYHKNCFFRVFTFPSSSKYGHLVLSLFLSFPLAETQVPYLYLSAFQ